MINSKTILLVEDDEDDQFIFSDALDALNFDLKLNVAGSCSEAFQTLGSKPLPDLIFLDINMPVMNGLEFLDEVKRIDHLAQIPVVILTTSDNPDLMKQTMDLGANGYIVKPANFRR